MSPQVICAKLAGEMEALYFAYGSNLTRTRMRDRVPSAHPRGVACLADHRLTLDKRGRDGSGKANLQPTPGAWVFGALYRLSAIHWGALDACEPGYRRVPVEVHVPGGTLEAWTYTSRDLTPHAIAYEWYKRLMVEGALEHGLPSAWQHRLRALPARSDPLKP